MQRSPPVEYEGGQILAFAVGEPGRPFEVLVWPVCAGSPEQQEIAITRLLVVRWPDTKKIVICRCDESWHWQVWSAEWGGPSFETVAEAKAWAEQAYRRPILWQDCA